MKAQALDLRRNVAEYLAATECSLAVNSKTSTLHEEIVGSQLLHMRVERGGNGWFKMGARQALPRHSTAHNQHSIGGFENGDSKG